MISSLIPVLALLSVSIHEASACGPNGHHYGRRSYEEPTPLAKRGAPYPSTDVGYAIPTPISAITTLPPDYSSTTLPVAATYTPGTQPSLAGAPVLPSATVNQAAYPSPDAIPPTDVDIVQQWMAAIDWTTIPDIAVNTNRNCSNPATVAAAGADQNCWWTCGGCTRDIDITTCDTTMEYGLGFDDGPGYYTPKLLRYLESQDLHANFYLVGSRVYYRPEYVQYEYMTGHHLSVHTWSHGGIAQLGLTEMTNEQVVAELGYTKQIIKEVTGVTPTTMRPPYGDIDDRVRAISLAMGLIPIIWTNKADPANPGSPIQWDSGDFDVHTGKFLAEPNQQRFEGVLNMSSQFTDHGVIALQHDLFSETVDLAIGYTIPFLLSHGFTLKPVLTCNGRPDSDAYQETNTNTNGPAQDDGDVATRSSDLGYALSHHNDPTVAPSRTYNTTLGHGTATGGLSTPTASRNGAAAAGISAGTPLAALMALVGLGITLML